MNIAYILYQTPNWDLIQYELHRGFLYACVGWTAHNDKIQQPLFTDTHDWVEGWIQKLTRIK